LISRPRWPTSRCPAASAWASCHQRRRAGILCIDACEAGGLEIPTVTERTRAELKAFLPAAASLNNPVDMIASATPEQYAKTIEIALQDPNLDALVVIYIPVGAADNKAIMAAVAQGVAAGRAAGAREKPSWP
jgi:acyl-CoA synthetase (NDP forming)